MFGRVEIFTDEEIITRENIGDIVRKAMVEHEKNVAMMNFLLMYESGIQPIKRKKSYRPDIDCECIDNVANEISDFKLNFGWGNPMTFVMRENINTDNNIPRAVSDLNIFYEIQGNRAKQQELARYVEICGLGYTYIDVNTEYKEGESPFTIDTLDPRCTFKIKSSYHVDKRTMVDVSFSCNEKGEKQYSCFTKDSRYELNNLFEHKQKSGEKNPIGEFPITEWFRSYDRMGCFERQISEMDNLNLLISDFTNDVEQNTQAVWHANDVDFPKTIVRNEDGTTEEKVIKPKTNDWMLTFTSRDGKTPFVNPLSINYDYSGMLNNIITRRSLILQKCNVPSRNDNSGGSTGIAMSDATGWTQAEVEATKQDQLKELFKINELKVVLNAIRECPGFPVNHPLMSLKAVDVKVSIKRQKTYEMTTKINAFATGVSHGINYKDMLMAINLFDDPQQVANNSRDTMHMYLESVFNRKENAPVGGLDEEKPNKDRLSPDNSDQINNSPNIETK